MNQIKRSLRDSKLARWWVLFVASAIMVMNYYFYDALSALKELMIINLGFSSSDYGIFMSAYSVPNVFLAMAVLGGIILDRIGIRITGFSFIFLMAAGSSITAYGASEFYLNGGFGYDLMNSFMPSFSPSLKMMYLGFFIFGLGAETSIVVLSKIVVKWFKGKELALALGLNLAIGRLGTALALSLSPKLIYPEWTNSIWFGVMLLWIALLVFIIYALMDMKLDKQEKIDIEEEEDNFKWADLKFLVTNKSFIFITLLCVTFYSAVFPFVKYAPDLLMNKYSFPREMAGNVSSYLMYGTILLTPLFGWIADNRGKSATLMYLGSALLIISHMLFAKTYIEPRIPIVILGIAFSLVPAAMWPAVTKIVGENKLGTAYGFMFSVQNIGLWAFPMLIGSVLDASNPNYMTSMDKHQFEQVQQNNLQYKGKVVDSKGEPVNDELNISLVAYNDSLEGDIVWKEVHKVETSEKGAFSIDIGEGDVLLNADFSYIIDTLDYKAKISVFSKKDTVTVYNDQLIYDEYQVFSSKISNEKFFDGYHEGFFTVFTRHGHKVWKEKIDFHIGENGGFEILIGKGRLLYADSKYFGFNDRDYAVEIIKPLDYTNPMLMLSSLGLLGLVFAFLLKREDKVSGYGLEKPNRDVEA